MEHAPGEWPTSRCPARAAQSAGPHPELVRGGHRLWALVTVQSLRELVSESELFSSSCAVWSLELSCCWT